MPFNVLCDLVIFYVIINRMCDMWHKHACIRWCGTHGHEHTHKHSFTLSFFQGHIKDLPLLHLEVVSDHFVKRPICREKHVELKQGFGDKGSIIQQQRTWEFGFCNYREMLSSSILEGFRGRSFSTPTSDAAVARPHLD